MPRTCWCFASCATASGTPSSSTASDRPWQGALRADSDIDYAVLLARPLDAVERFDLQEDVARALRRSVDLVDLRRASTVLRMQVVASGVAVAVGDAIERERFEILTYASYARLNEERRAILEQIAEERTVYGR